MERAMQEFERRISVATGKEPPPGPRLIIARDVDEYKRLRTENEHANVVRGDYGWPSDFYQQSIGNAVFYRTAMYEIASGSENLHALPTWFRHGVAWRVAYSVVGSLGDSHVRASDFDADAEIDLRHSKVSTSSLTAMFSLSSSGSVSEIEEFNNLASFAVQRLESRMGPRFDRAWTSVIHAAGRRGAFDFASEFETAFGISLEAFRAQVQADLALMLWGKRIHSAPLPVLNPAVAISDEGRLPHRHDAFVAGYRKYLAAAAPKAFAYSRSGAWVFKNDVPNAMEWALRECGSISPLGCKLYAVDDWVVLPSSNPQAGIEVVMESEGKDAWTKEVSSRWLPVVRQSVTQFQNVLQSRFDLHLSEATRVYVVSNRQDYQRLLRDKFGETERSSLIAAEGTDGLANASGQIAAALFSTTDTDELWESATLLTLHELVHEMQNQLAAGNAGFWVPRWIKEGSAEQISYMMAREMPLDTSAKFTIPDWRDICIEWYKLRGSRSTQPEDVLDKSFDEWLALSQSGKQPYKMAGLMLEFLKDRLGERYYPALLKYLRMAALPDMEEAVAFETCFGLSPKRFLQELKPWLKAL